MSSLDINTKKNSANILQDLEGTKILVQEARFSNWDRLEEWTWEWIDKNKR